ncbi:pyridoxamine 5'-phosphate oxidase family protein [bacterium]|nr:pyridoxamine 5'-phosphate oxidase family protein [bacterium]
MTHLEFKTLAKDILKRAQACYLSTLDDRGQPLIRAMNNLRNLEQYPVQAKWINKNLSAHTVLFTTTTNSAKVHQLIKNPKASVLYAVPGEFKGITFLGEMKVTTDNKIRHGIFHEDWRLFYPQGALDPNHSLLIMEPVLSECWFDNKKTTFALETIL